VTWLLRRLVRFGRARGALVCYLRENGPIAYAFELFGRDPRERASALLATDLAWYWRTIGSGAGVREWTRLTAWSLAALLADVGDPSALPPALVLIGIDVGDAPPEVDDARAAQWMGKFDGGADRPLHAVIARYPPDPELLFVAQHPPDDILHLLQACGIDRDRADRQAYPRLRERSLSQLARSIANERSE
jgi:hypothetical protein